MQKRGEQSNLFSLLSLFVLFIIFASFFLVSVSAATQSNKKSLQDVLPAGTHPIGKQFKPYLPPPKNGNEGILGKIFRVGANTFGLQPVSIGIYGDACSDCIAKFAADRSLPIEPKSLSTNPELMTYLMNSPSAKVSVAMRVDLGASSDVAKGMQNYLSETLTEANLPSKERLLFEAASESALSKMGNEGYVVIKPSEDGKRSLVSFYKSDGKGNLEEVPNSRQEVPIEYGNQIMNSALQNPKARDSPNTKLFQGVVEEAIDKDKDYLTKRAQEFADAKKINIEEKQKEQIAQQNKPADSTIVSPKPSTDKTQGIKDNSEGYDQSLQENQDAKPSQPTETGTKPNEEGTIGLNDDGTEVWIPSEDLEDNWKDKYPVYTRDKNDWISDSKGNVYGAAEADDPNTGYREVLQWKEPATTTVSPKPQQDEENDLVYNQKTGYWDDPNTGYVFNDKGDIVEGATSSHIYDDEGNVREVVRAQPVPSSFPTLSQYLTQEADKIAKEDAYAGLEPSTSSKSQTVPIYQPTAKDDSLFGAVSDYLPPWLSNILNDGGIKVAENLVLGVGGVPARLTLPGQETAKNEKEIGASIFVKSGGDKPAQQMAETKVDIPGSEKNTQIAQQTKPTDSTIVSPKPSTVDETDSDRLIPSDTTLSPPPIVMPKDARIVKDVDTGKEYFFDEKGVLWPVSAAVKPNEEGTIGLNDDGTEVWIPSEDLEDNWKDKYPVYTRDKNDWISDSKGNVYGAAEADDPNTGYREVLQWKEPATTTVSPKPQQDEENDLVYNQKTGYWDDPNTGYVFNDKGDIVEGATSSHIYDDEGNVREVVRAQLVQQPLVNSQQDEEGYKTPATEEENAPYQPTIRVGPNGEIYKDDKQITKINPVTSGLDEGDIRLSTGKINTNRAGIITGNPEERTIIDPWESITKDRDNNGWPDWIPFQGSIKSNTAQQAQSTEKGTLMEENGIKIWVPDSDLYDGWEKDYPVYTRDKNDWIKDSKGNVYGAAEADDPNTGYREVLQWQEPAKKSVFAKIADALGINKKPTTSSSSSDTKRLTDNSFSKGKDNYYKDEDGIWHKNGEAITQKEAEGAQAAMDALNNNKPVAKIEIPSLTETGDYDPNTGVFTPNPNGEYSRNRADPQEIRDVMGTLMTPKTEVAKTETSSGPTGTAPMTKEEIAALESKIPEDRKVTDPVTGNKWLYDENWNPIAKVNPNGVAERITYANKPSENPSPTVSPKPATNTPTTSPGISAPGESVAMIDKNGKKTIVPMESLSPEEWEQAQKDGTAFYRDQKTGALYDDEGKLAGFADKKLGDAKFNPIKEATSENYNQNKDGIFVDKKNPNLEYYLDEDGNWRQYNKKTGEDYVLSKGESEKFDDLNYRNAFPEEFTQKGTTTVSPKSINYESASSKKDLGEIDPTKTEYVQGKNGESSKKYFYGPDGSLKGYYDFKTGEYKKPDFAASPTNPSDFSAPKELTEKEADALIKGGYDSKEFKGNLPGGSTTTYTLPDGSKLEYNYKTHKYTLKEPTKSLPAGTPGVLDPTTGEFKPFEDGQDSKDVNAYLQSDGKVLNSKGEAIGEMNGETGEVEMYPKPVAYNPTTRGELVYDPENGAWKWKDNPNGDLYKDGDGNIHNGAPDGTIIGNEEDTAEQEVKITDEEYKGYYEMLAGEQGESGGKTAGKRMTAGVIFGYGR